MKDLDKCECNSTCCADIDWNKDNGYKYVLDELKATRAHIDTIISVIEKRIEKDAIIDEVLNTDYPDEDEHETKTNDYEDSLEELLKTIALKKAFNDIWIDNRYRYPYWSIYPRVTKY